MDVIRRLIDLVRRFVADRVAYLRSLRGGPDT